MSLVYFAHPIDQVDLDHHLVTLTRTAAARAELSLFQPGKAYSTLGEQVPLHEIDRINRAALNACSGILAVVPADEPTLGVPVEIERALDAGKPTVIVTDQKLIETSVQIEAWGSRGAWVLNENDLGEHDLATMLHGSPTPEQAMQYTLSSVHATVPWRAYPDDAGFDLAITHAAKIEPGGRQLLPTRVSFALPEGTFGLILGRSSTWANRGLVVMPGVIDVGWRGELYVSVWNPGDTAVWLDAGDRLGQFIVLPSWPGRLEQVAALPAHERGTNGFGSSGA